MSGDLKRREADATLAEVAWLIMLDRETPLLTRVKASTIYVVMRLRVVLRWNNDPAGWLVIRVHGNYCGPRHSRTELPPIDDLDCACKVHDVEYTAARSNEPPSST